MHCQPNHFKLARIVIVTVSLLLSLVVVMVTVELPLRNLLMTMWCFSDCNLFVLFAILSM